MMYTAQPSYHHGVQIRRKTIPIKPKQSTFYTKDWQPDRRAVLSQVFSKAPQQISTQSKQVEGNKQNCLPDGLLEAL